ncbi:tetratricopeptide repeat protein (macronuclear) [Tetrahymena thermophila SB210]|uniref:Tetratricopeptide repeat protein n=1 Tax=Tetrahymena thermophila (strain SB210) TaxID=312017 RepID=I7LTQ4_TETTS|nr:tetratricopeptide repeat protein [Tetrahymena thermophila SB210]EAR85661.1 tetratricopeptide repeat protein [Tetrahymena thermophila SB210]|eukprot:XP_001033324.1 tetratricopeptide repeat protein [Tetrahymena thermophila SB210]
MINPIFKKKNQIEQLENNIKSLYKQGSYKLCIQECEKLANIYVTKKEIVYLYLGKCYMNLGDYEKSKQSFIYCLSINQLNLECYINLGTIYAQLNEYELAFDYFDKYEQLIENDKKSKEYPKRKVGLLQNLCNTCFIQKDYDKTEQYINQLLDIDPSNKAAKIIQGDIFYMKEEFEKALEMYFQVLENDKNAISACYKIGMTNWKLEKFTEAISNFELCLALDKYFIDSYAAIAMILHRHLEKYDESLFNLNLYLQYNKKDPLKNVQIYMEMGQIYETLFKSKDAIEQYKKAFDINPNNADPLSKIANIYFEKRQDYQAAIEYYEKIIRIKPSCKTSFIRLAKCYFQLQKYDKCIQVYKNELLLDPYNSETFQAIALCYQELKNYKESDLYFQLSLQINPFDNTVKEQYEKLKQLISAQNKSNQNKK